MGHCFSIRGVHEKGEKVEKKDTPSSSYIFKAGTVMHGRVFESRDVFCHRGIAESQSSQREENL